MYNVYMSLIYKYIHEMLIYEYVVYNCVHPCYYTVNVFKQFPAKAIDTVYLTDDLPQLSYFSAAYL